MSAVPRSWTKLLSCAVALVAGLTIAAGCASGSDATAEISAVDNTPVQTTTVTTTGSFDADGQSFGLAATGLTIIGTMTGADQMNLRFFRVADPPTSFQVMVERTSSQRS